MQCLAQISNSKGESSAKSDIDLKIGGFHLVGSLQVRASRGAVVIVLRCGSAKKQKNKKTHDLFLGLRAQVDV